MTVSVALPFTLVNNTVADATQVMANFNALVTGFTQAASAGANNDITALNGLLTPITPGQGGSNVYIGSVVAGTSLAMTVGATTPANFTFTQGYGITFIPTLSNTGPTTLDVTATGAQPVTKIGSAGIQQLDSGDIQIGSMAYLLADGTKYILLNPATADGGLGFGAGVAVIGTTADIGAGAPNHLAGIAGGTITSFGSSASLNAPHYTVVFSAPTVISYNAASLITPGTANITAAANDVAELLYLGAGNWQVVGFTRANGTAVVNPTPLPGVVGLFMTNNAGTPTLSWDYGCEFAVLINPTGNVPIFGRNISGTIDTNTGTGAGNPAVNGMAGEGRPANGWGYVYLISNGAIFAGLVSTNSVAPTSLPAGYNYFVRVGAVRFTGAAELQRMIIRGNEGRYRVTAGSNTTAYPTILTTSAQVWPVVVVVQTGATNFIAPTAYKAKFVVYGDTNTNIALSTSDATLGNTAASNLNPSEYSRADVAGKADMVELLLSGTSIVVGATNTGNWALRAYGWTDAVNAN